MIHRNRCTEVFLPLQVLHRLQRPRGIAIILFRICCGSNIRKGIISAQLCSLFRELLQRTAVEPLKERIWVRLCRILASFQRVAQQLSTGSQPGVFMDFRRLTGQKVSKWPAMFKHFGGFKNRADGTSCVTESRCSKSRREETASPPAEQMQS